MSDFRNATASASPDQLDRDLAGAIAATAVAVGAERAADAAARSLTPQMPAGALRHLHRPALDPLLAQSRTYVASAAEGIGSVAGPLPFGRAVAVEVANAFSALAGGTAAVFATRVRFYQQQGYDATVALSSGAIMITGSWIATTVLFLVSLPFARGSIDLEATPQSGGNSKLVWIILAVVVLVALVAGLVLAVPRLRRLAAEKALPKVRDIWGNLKQVASSPRKLVLLVGGSFGRDLLVAMVDVRPLPEGPPECELNSGGATGRIWMARDARAGQDD